MALSKSGYSRTQIAGFCYKPGLYPSLVLAEPRLPGFAMTGLEAAALCGYYDEIFSGRCNS
jgi:hypothetical protein